MRRATERVLMAEYQRARDRIEQETAVIGAIGAVLAARDTGRWEEERDAVRALLKARGSRR